MPHMSAPVIGKLSAKVKMKKIGKFLAVISIVLIAYYPVTSLYATCASYPLDDFFFSIYWPGTKWLLGLGLHNVAATMLAVMVPNLLIISLMYRLASKIIKN